MTIEIINADCRTFDPAWAGDFQCMIVDPPYRDHVHDHAVSAGMIDYGVGPRKRDFGFKSLSHALRSHVARVGARINGWSIIHSDCESLTRWRNTCEARGLPYIRPLPWIRWSQPQKSGDRPTSVVEMISVYHPEGRKRWNGPGSHMKWDTLDDLPAAVEHKSERGAEKHPTAKPLDLCLDLVSWFSAPGDHVLDLTCGRGPVGLACALLGRSFTGFELDPEHARLARERCTDPAGLSDRDLERAERWLARTPATTGPEPEKRSELRTWERLCRRVADRERVQAWLR